MKRFFFLVAALLLLPSFVSAFDCSKVSDSAYCESIKSSGIDEEEKDSIFSSMLYGYSEFPNHDLIRAYNLGIEVDSQPYGTQGYGLNYIKNAWFSFLAVFPSVYEDKTLFVPEKIEVLSAYDYDIVLPKGYKADEYPETSQGDCKRRYSVESKKAIVNYYLNGIYKGEGKYALLNINSNGILKAELNVNLKVRVKHYGWQRYWLGSWAFYRCRYHHSTYKDEKLKIEESKDIVLYEDKPQAEVRIIDRYQDTSKGEYSGSEYSLLRVDFQDSFYSKQKYHYDLVFEKKPYYFAYLRARNFNHIKQKNLFSSDNTLFVKNEQNCTISTYNHFYTETDSCTIKLEESNKTLAPRPFRDLKINDLFYLIMFILLIYFIYKLLEGYARKVAPTFVLVLLLAPFVAAAGEECGLTNLASCIPQKIYEFILVLINAPLLPLLSFIQKLLTTEVSIGLFQGVWSAIRYVLGFFYVFLFIYAGYVFLTSSANPIRRAQAKELLKDTFLMIVFIQGSFYIYGLVLSLGSVLNSSVLSMIDPHFFMLTADNIVNIGLELIFGMVYAITLFVTMIMLVIRYVVVSIGVVMFPVAIFCYFIPPLKGYGRFLLNVIGIFVFVTFFDLLIILACSLVVQAPIFENFKIVVMITCFSIINYTLWLAIKFALKRSANVSLKDDLGQAVKYIAMVA